jgi:hypothetical protein
MDWRRATREAIILCGEWRHRIRRRGKRGRCEAGGGIRRRGGGKKGV